MSHYKETVHGFEFGAAKVSRLCSDDKAGWVSISVSTPRDEVQVYITKTGKVRVWNKKGEMKS